jgi:hypothetical protein
MNVNVYLPDDLGRQAKEAQLALSLLLRNAVIDELGRREAVSATLEEAQEHKIVFEDHDGRTITGRLYGVQICEETHHSDLVLLTDDERVIVYDSSNLRYWESEDPETDLREVLDDGRYIDAMTALGISPVIDI